MYKSSIFQIICIISALFCIGCNRSKAINAQDAIADSNPHMQDVTADDNPSVVNNLTWLCGMGIYTDSLIVTDTIPNAFSRKGVYLDDLQIKKLIANKIPRRKSSLISSIRLFSIKELDDSLTLCTYVYEFSDIEDIYMLIYKNAQITDILKLPIPEKSNLSNVINGTEYIDYFKSSVIFTDNSHFTISERTSTEGWNNDNKCVFYTEFEIITVYYISTDGKIHKGDVIKSQSCQG